MNKLLSRVDIAGSLEDLLVRVADEYRLGAIRSHDVLPNGYQELNVLLGTTTGRFIVKIFSKEKTLQRVQDNVWGYRTFREGGVPMPMLQKTILGEYIFSTEGKRRTTYVCVMDYFNGSYLEPKDATDDDIRALAKYMAIIHSHTQRIHRYYDTMGIVNLISQYNKFKQYLPSELLTLIKPVVKGFPEINPRNFRHSIIHGTFEPENILKNVGGDLTLLDLGCMDYNASIVDVVTFLANYTIDLPTDQKRKHVNLFLESYQAIHQLSKQERAALPTLIRAQYATIMIRSNYYIRTRRDTSPQTRRLFAFARRGLMQMAEGHYNLKK